jgi:hypothetical protein
MLTTNFHLMPRLRRIGAIPQLPQYIFMAWCLVKHRDNFTFYLPNSVGHMGGTANDEMVRI